MVTGSVPYSDCEQVIDGDEIKHQAQAGHMGEQLYAVVYKKRVERILKSGKRGKDKWVRGYRAPRQEDDNAAGNSGQTLREAPRMGGVRYGALQRNFPRTALMIALFNTECLCGGISSLRASFSVTALASKSFGKCSMLIARTG